MKISHGLPGLFITFEGGEGCGKSTQFARLTARLQAHLGNTASSQLLTLREPGGTVIGEEIRALLKSAERGHTLVPAAELLLFAASRAQLVREVLQPALTGGKLVLCDRFLDSTTVYQGAARQLDAAAVASVNAFAVAGCVPDATILLDLPTDAVRERLAGRANAAPLLLSQDRFDTEQDHFFERVRAGYLELAASAPERVILIDAAGSPAEVEQKILVRLREKFPIHHVLFSA